MLRRSLHHRVGIRLSSVLLESANTNTNNGSSSSSSPYTTVDRDGEIRREEDLRARVVKGMPMSFPKLDHTVYASYETSPGQFNSNGNGLSGGSNGGGSSASSASGGSSAMPHMPFPFSFASGNKNNNNSGNSNSGGSASQQKPRAGLSDYFVFATGLVLIAYSLKLLFKGAGANANGTIIPMWVNTPIQKARYIVFTLITTEPEREALRREFTQVQATMPFLAFFDWLDQRYPNWAAGRKYPQEHVFNVMAQAIGPNSTAGSIARLTASVMQKRTGGIFGLSASANPVSDRMSLVDELVDSVAPTAAKNSGSSAEAAAAPFGFGGGAGAPPPFYPNVNPQWGMPQQQAFAAHAPPAYAGYQPHQQHQQNQQQQSYYHQQPASAEFKGTQEVSLSDITGGAAAVPQHRYYQPQQASSSHSPIATPPSNNGNSAGNNNSIDSVKTVINGAEESAGSQQDPLKRRS